MFTSTILQFYFFFPTYSWGVNLCCSIPHVPRIPRILDDLYVPAFFFIGNGSRLIQVYLVLALFPYVVIDGNSTSKVESALCSYELKLGLSYQYVGRDMEGIDLGVITFKLFLSLSSSFILSWPFDLQNEVL